MDIKIRRELNETYIILPAGEINEVAYRIMSESPGGHLMRPELAGGGEECAFAVSGGSIVMNKYRSGQFTLQKVRRLFFDLEKAAAECEQRLMKPGNIILRPQLIVEKEDGSFIFLAHPGETGDFFLCVKRLVHFCTDLFSGNDEEKAVMEKLRLKADEELFTFEDLLAILAERRAPEEPSPKPSEKPSDRISKQNGLLLPLVLLILAAAFFLLYHLTPLRSQPRLLLASFVCLAASVAGTVIRISKRSPYKNLPDA